MKSEEEELKQELDELRDILDSPTFKNMINDLGIQSLGEKLENLHKKIKDECEAADTPEFKKKNAFRIKIKEAIDEGLKEIVNLDQPSISKYPDLQGEVLEALVRAQAAFSSYSIDKEVSKITGEIFRNYAQKLYGFMGTIKPPECHENCLNSYNYFIKLGKVCMDVVKVIDENINPVDE